MTNEHNDFQQEIEVIEVDANEAESLAEAPQAQPLPEEPKEVRSSYNKKEYDDYIFTRYHGGKRKRFLSPSVNHNTTQSYTSKNHFVKEVHHLRR